MPAAMCSASCVPPGSSRASDSESSNAASNCRMSGSAAIGAKRGDNDAVTRVVGLHRLRVSGRLSAFAEHGGTRARWLPACAQAPGGAPARDLRRIVVQRHRLVASPEVPAGSLTRPAHARDATGHGVVGADDRSVGQGNSRLPGRTARAGARGRRLLRRASLVEDLDGCAPRFHHRADNSDPLDSGDARDNVSTSSRNRCRRRWTSSSAH